MLTEFEVRCRMDEIRASRMSPLRKARMLLRLSKSLSRQSKALRQAKVQISKSTDRNAASGMTRMTSRTQLLLSEVRDAAYDALSTGRRSRPFST